MTRKRTTILLMMATLLTGSFITTLAETLMNNGLPMIMKETHVTQMSAQWLNTGYMLVADGPLLHEAVCTEAAVHHYHERLSSRFFGGNLRTKLPLLTVRTTHSSSRGRN